MALALFDLDETLIAGDSDYLWGKHLIEKGVVDRESYEKANRDFYEQYKQGSLDIVEFSRFAFQPLSQHPIETLHAWRDEFIQEKIKPIMLKKGLDFVNMHRMSGDKIIIITATNEFLTQPIADLYQVDKLLATKPAMLNGKYTGELEQSCFSTDKVTRLHEWLKEQGENLDGSFGYSDSHNDIPLLKEVTHAVAVDPDEKLQAYALKYGWRKTSFRPAEDLAREK